MPQQEKQEYNPVIIGYSEQDGPLNISLKEARKGYGSLPSSYGLVPRKEGRERKKGLNLKTGSFIRETLEDSQKNLKGVIYRYFKSWHRDYLEEFGVDTAPFRNLNDPKAILSLIGENQQLFSSIKEMDLKTTLLEKGLIRKDVLLSVKESDLPETAVKLLNRKIRDFSSENKKQEARLIISSIRAREIIESIETLTGTSILSPENEIFSCYADEIAHLFLKFPEEISLKGKSSLDGIKGKGVEFTLAPRDSSFLKLGKDTGDCTSDKRSFQADRDVENIFWTVFSWILDQNYQVLKVYHEGEFVMKVHLLPLYITEMESAGSRNQYYLPGKSDYMILAVDAVETIRGFRDDIPEGQKRKTLLTEKDMIFGKTMDMVKELASSMGISHVYAEKFSNTKWVRETYESYPEIFLHVDHIIKIDQLEDIYYLARGICRASGHELPDELFMEIQMKNTFLSPQFINKAPGVKSFSIIKGSPENGIPMSRVIGI